MQSEFLQYQDDINALNEMARHRPRANLIMGLLQENNQIRELQQENKDLRLALEEHQSAIELIMTKYREQVVKLMRANHLTESTYSGGDNSEVGITVVPLLKDTLEGHPSRKDTNSWQEVH